MTNKRTVADDVLDSTAVYFVGWQEFKISDDDKNYPPPAPLYNVEVDPFNGSTVCAHTLLQHGIKVPPTPSFDEWKKRG